MSKLVKVLAVVVLIGGALAATPGPAEARYWHHHYHGGWGGGWGFGFGYPYYARPYYASPYYYAPPPACGWTRVRVWRHGHWVVRRAWRCW